MLSDKVKKEMVLKNIIIKFGDMLFVSDDYNYELEEEEEVIGRFNIIIVEYNKFDNLSIREDYKFKNENFIKFNNSNLEFILNNDKNYYNKRLYERGRLDYDWLLDFIDKSDINYLYNVVRKNKDRVLKKVIIVDIDYMREG